MVFAVMSACTQALGYALYIRYTLREEIEPNPVTWLMFAYGTALLAFLEWRSGAEWPELLLPVTCALSSIVVAGICGVRGNLRWPSGYMETAAFVTDIALTIAYVGLWFASRHALIAPEYQVIALLTLLICVNGSTVAAFVPIIKSTISKPQHERFLPWIVWAIAYLLLLLATLGSRSVSESLELLIYPAMNLVLHAVVGLLAHHRARQSEVTASFLVKETGKTGMGLFATRPFNRGDLVFAMTGTEHFYESRSRADAFKFENWLCIGKDRWLDPDPPFVFSNHSCDPNLGIRGAAHFIALRDIAAGEELTFDYSITDDELDWSMPCACAAQECRKIARSIQFLPDHIFTRYLPFVNPYIQSVFAQCNRPALLATSDKMRSAVNSDFDFDPKHIGRQPIQPRD
jgi:hypothetical protein